MPSSLATIAPGEYNVCRIERKDNSYVIVTREGLQIWANTRLKLVLSIMLCGKAVIRHPELGHLKVVSHNDGNILEGNGCRIRISDADFTIRTDMGLSPNEAAKCYGQMYKHMRHMNVAIEKAEKNRDDWILRVQGSTFLAPQLLGKVINNCVVLIT
jgi:hypothetical protein